jgi:serralysin
VRDVINDFVVGVDTIDVSALDANTDVASDQAFIWVGTAGITAAGQLSMAYDSTTNTTLVSGNVDANLAPDFMIALTGNYSSTLTATEFVL